MKRSILAIGLLVSSFARGQNCNWTMEPGRLGPVSVGMSIPQAEGALGMHLKLIRTSDETNYFYLPQKCKKSFMVIATNYNTDAKGSIRIAMIVAGDMPTIDGIRVGDSEQKLRKATVKNEKYLSREQKDHYDTDINAYTFESSVPRKDDSVLTYFAPGGVVNSIVASAKKYVYMVDIGRPTGKWWTHESIKK